jgi:hypothetical protein
MTMGRIIPSWRTIFHRQIERWRRRRGFYHALRDRQHRDAFDLLLRAWCREDAAMHNANIPCVLDILTLMANIHETRCLEGLKQRAKDAEE